MGADEAEPPGAYRDLLDRYGRIANLENAREVLSWDQQVMMPEGGTPARSKQVSALSAQAHDLLVDDAVGEWLDALGGADLADERRATAREIRRRYERATRVPSSLVEEISETTAEALPRWKRARAEGDFDEFAPVLERLVELKREYAAHVDDDRDPYAVLFEEYEPYLGLDVAERTLERLRDELVPLIDAVAESDVTLPTPFEGTFDAGTQEEVARDALDLLGYDWDRGRLDVAPHPFSTGTMFDARVTTRFDEADPLDSLSSTVHEFGHAAYTLALPEEAYATPLGEPRDLTVHESQSRFWENHVARSAAFWEQFLPRMAERFPALSEVTPDEAYAAANRVRTKNPIRVEADELTYHMHVVLRFEIERDLVSGALDVADVPRAWNERMDAYLGVRPDTDAEGCLQDIHWSHGSFGYFPTYSLGSVLAAQLAAHLQRDVDLDGCVRAGEFGPVHDWLTERVRRHGKRYTTDELVREATDEPFTADHFLAYVAEKYGELYDL